MTVPVLFALVGAVILLGFLGNLLFRLTHIPSVLLLIGIGVVLGPVTGWIRHDALIAIAPYFGAVALLVILFEGGLELDIAHVVRHAPRTTVLAVTVFGLSLVSVAAVAHYALGLPLLTALMLGAVLGATSPAICMPVVSGLAVRTDVKTVVKLESAMGEVLLIVSVVLLIESHATGASGPAGWVWGFTRSWLVALVVSSVAGVLWSRLVSWLSREPLSYMLTLGVVCLLYFAVEELGGSPAIAVLAFGVILANMQSIAARFGQRFRDLFGIDIREEQFVLNQFMVNITAELSFLVRTFFFVYLGLLLDFSALSWPVALWIALMFGLLLASRRLGVAMFGRGGASFSPPELGVIMALQPRGLATAVVAFLPVQAGVPGSSAFPLFAFVVIVLSNLFMTGGILFAERRRRIGVSAQAPDVSGLMPEPEWPPPAGVAEEALRPASAAIDASRAVAPQPPFSPSRDFADEPTPVTFTDWMARFFGLRLSDREAEYAEMIRASYLSEPLFWVQAALGAAICALGLVLNQTAIVIGGALIVPLVRPVIATGLALASGDLFLLVRLVVKLLGFSVLAVVLSAGLGSLLPFAAATAEAVARTRPTILDFLVALCGGMSGAALISLRRQVFHYLPGAVIAITLLPALCVMGFGLGDSSIGPVFRGAALQFTANLFAAVLGAGVILSLVGIPKAAQCASVRQWKEAELASPLASAVFGRLGLQRVIGRTGSVRARLIVVSIFLLALLVPLQLAFNQLTAEFRTRQAISQVQAMFSVPDRSAVISSAFALHEESVDVRLQVAANELFGADDIARFEERVSDRVGRRAQLDLVQTLADVGNGQAIRRLLAGNAGGPAPPPQRTVSESLDDAGRTAAAILTDLPLPDSLRVVTLRAGVGTASASLFDLVYLADTQLGPDAQSMLVQLLARRTGIEADRLRLRWVPAAATVRLTRAGQLARGEERVLEDLQRALADYPGLQATLELPSGLTARAAESGRERVQGALALDDLPVAASDAEPRQLEATLRISLPAGDQ